MEWRLVSDQKKWDEFVAGQIHAQFLQSWKWGEFQKSYGRRVWRVGCFLNEEQVAAAQIIEHYMGMGFAYLYIPRGPLFKEGTEADLKGLVEFIKKQLVNYGTVFVKIEGQKMEQVNLIGAVRKLSVQPANTVLLDLQKTEGELLSGMHQKTRYNIRLAYKKDLDFRIVNNENFEEEWQLLRATGRRDRISLHSKRYYQLMDRILSEQDNLIYKKFFVFKDSRALVAGVFIGFGDTFTYVHGASSSKYRELMAPYLLQWEAIKYAKEKGYRYYDFGGVNPIDKKDWEFRSRWEGISRFKYGFGGSIYNFGVTFDIILKNKGYQLFSLLKKIKHFL